MRRFMRVASLLVFVLAAIGAVTRLRRAIAGGPSAPAGAPIRTGSFDNWPAVPAAPGSHRSGD